MGTFARVSLWLFVIVLGIAFGAGLYETRINVPRWMPDGTWDAAAARLDDTGLRFWAFVSTGPLTLLTLVNGILAWRSKGSLRTWWGASVVAALGDRLMTFGYFIPTMIGLMDAADSPATRELAMQWASLNHLRHAFLIVAWLAALKALTLFESRTAK